MGDKTVSDEMQMYSHVFSVLGKCTDDYLFVLDLQNNRYMISDSATKIFPFEATEMSNAFKALESICRILLPDGQQNMIWNIDG